MIAPLENHSYYPAFLDLAGRLVVVIGGAAVAERKVDTLLSCGAVVRVVSPHATARICELAQTGAVSYTARAYVQGDLTGAFMVICTAAAAEVKLAVAAEAAELGALLNMAVPPPAGNVIIPATLRRGPLQIAVSTGGAAPAVARAVRAELEQTFDASWGDYVELMAAVRPLVLTRVAEAAQRRAIFTAIAAADWLERLRAGEAISAEQVFDEIRGDDFGQT